MATWPLCFNKYIHVYDVVLSQSDVSKKDDEDAVEPVPPISEFVVDDLRKYVTDVSDMYSEA